MDLRTRGTLDIEVISQLSESQSISVVVKEGEKSREKCLQELVAALRVRVVAAGSKLAAARREKGGGNEAK